MSGTELAPGPVGDFSPRGDGGPGTEVLLAEANRQLTICNACRYCEGLCPVFPALARRTVLGDGDASQLANLCHDCRGCFDACMYSSPHEFAVDLPLALASVRLADYTRYVWPRRVPRALSGASGMWLGSALCVLTLLLIVVVSHGWDALIAYTGRPSSPYQLISYPVLLIMILGATLFAALVMAQAGRRYWQAAGEPLRRPDPAVLLRAVWQSLTLRHLRGGGEGCYYPDDERPASARRRFHGLVVTGFGLCLLSTVAAAISQDIVGDQPPYPWLSVPVISGAAGGVALLAGCAGLLVLKTRSSPATSVTAMTIKDYGLLCALVLLAASGLAVLLTRDTAAFGIVLIVHLAAVIEALAMAPYSKFIHSELRFLAVLRDGLEQAAAGR